MKMKVILFSFVLSILSVANAMAQCAMCKATMENDNSQTVLAEGLNNGILYLMFIPYIAIASVAFLWYRASKKKSLEANTNAN